jgi:hypothetical protein
MRLSRRQLARLIESALNEVPANNPASKLGDSAKSLSGGGEAGSIGKISTGRSRPKTFTYKNDGFTYVVRDGQWHVIKGSKKIASAESDYINLKKYPDSIKALDTEHPNARSENARNKDVGKRMAKQMTQNMQLSDDELASAVNPASSGASKTAATRKQGAQDLDTDNDGKIEYQSNMDFDEFRDWIDGAEEQGAIEYEGMSDSEFESWLDAPETKKEYQSNMDYDEFMSWMDQEEEEFDFDFKPSKVEIVPESRNRRSLKKKVLSEAKDSSGNLVSPPGDYIPVTGDTFNVAGVEIELIRIQSNGQLNSFDTQNEEDVEFDEDMEMSIHQQLAKPDTFMLNKIYVSDEDEFEFSINDINYALYKFADDRKIYVQNQDDENDYAEVSGNEFDLGGKRYNIFHDPGAQDISVGGYLLKDYNSDNIVSYLTKMNSADDTSLTSSTSTTSTSSKKGLKYNASTEGIQKIIDPTAKHTKADGQWGKGTQRAWEEYVNSGEFEFAMDKTYPNVSDEEIINIIDDLPKKASSVTKLDYKGDKTGVLSFLQDVSDDEIIRTDVKLGDVTSGGDAAAVEKVIDGEEMPDDKFIKDIDADLFGEKLKDENPKNKDRLVNKLADTYRAHRDEKKKKRLAKKIRRMLKDDPKALAAFNAAAEPFTLEESESRGSLYRRRYWGRY